MGGTYHTVGQREVKGSGPRQTTQVRKGQAETVGWGRCDSIGCRTKSL